MTVDFVITDFLVKRAMWRNWLVWSFAMHRWVGMLPTSQQPLLFSMSTGVIILTFKSYYCSINLVHFFNLVCPTVIPSATTTDPIR